MRLRTADTIAAILGMGGLGIILIDAELFYQNNKGREGNFEATPLNLLLRIAILGSAIANLPFIIW